MSWSSPCLSLSPRHTLPQKINPSPLPDHPAQIPPSDRAALEQRRLAAATALRAGFSQAKIAEVYGVSSATASRWARAVLAGDNLRAKMLKGRPSRLSEEQTRTLYKAYAAARRGGARWTAQVFTDEIAARFGIVYHRDYAGLILRKMRAQYDARR